MMPLFVLCDNNGLRYVKTFFALHTYCQSFHDAEAIVTE